MNHSVNSSTLEHHEVMYAASVVTLLLVPPINFYVLLLIARGGLETITSEFYCLNLAISDIPVGSETAQSRRREETESRGL
ncbi:unnamed protein product [Arctogadus glacialis]